MARNVNDILFRFLADTKSLDRGTRKAKKDLGGVQKSMGGLAKAAGGVAAAFAAAKVVDFAGDAIQLAIAADEVDSKFQAVFGTATDLNDALREWGDIAGVTEQSGRDLAATFGNLAQAQGISLEETKELTLLVAELAGDMASFNDEDPEQVFFDLNKALLTTEREGMKKYGIALTETEIKQRALDIAVADGRTEFTKADKALASYELTVEQAGKAVGDLERTSDSTANVQRALKASFEETQEEIGRRLLPVYEDLLSITVDLQPQIIGLVNNFGDLLGGLGDITGALVDIGGDEGKGNVDRVTDAIAGMLRIADSTPMTRFMGGFDEMAGAFDRAGESSISMADALAMRYGPTVADAADETEDLAEAIDAVNKELLDQQAAMVAVIAGGGSLAQFFFDARVQAEKLLAAQIAINQLLAGGGGSGEVAEPTPGDGPPEHFATGGTVGGPRGKAQLAVVHGGETVTPAGRSNGGVTINVEFSGVVGDPTAVAEQIQDLLEQYTRTNVSF